VVIIFFSKSYIIKYCYPTLRFKRLLASVRLQFITFHRIKLIIVNPSLRNKFCSSRINLDLETWIQICICPTLTKGRALCSPIILQKMRATFTFIIHERNFAYVIMATCGFVSWRYKSGKVWRLSVVDEHLHNIRYRSLHFERPGNVRHFPANTKYIFMFHCVIQESRKRTWNM
jgi:hypothetical protein